MKLGVPTQIIIVLVIDSMNNLRMNGNQITIIQSVSIWQTRKCKKPIIQAANTYRYECVWDDPVSCTIRQHKCDRTVWREMMENYPPIPYSVSRPTRAASIRIKREQISDRSRKQY